LKHFCSRLYSALHPTRHNDSVNVRTERRRERSRKRKREEKEKEKRIKGLKTCHFFPC